ncbi:MAG: hypothetical protein LBU22_06655 [Dysgonamonadaceae bacterium]|jgi:hypothetical protein|nr:hypothetical protein [Dysgonamonadaceae bacterium]
MIQKKIFSFVLFAGLFMGFTGCNDLDSDGVYVYTGLIGVVSYNWEINKCVIGLGDGEYVVDDPALLLAEGECIYIIQMTIDSKNQASDKYVTATGVQYQILARSYPVAGAIPPPLGDYNLLLSDPGAYISPYFKGNLFLSAAFTKFEKQSAQFSLTYDPDEAPLNGTRTLYLQAKLSGEETGNKAQTNDIQTVEMNGLINYLGRDTIISAISFRYLKFNLKYLSDIRDNEPVYSSVTDTPIELAVFN